MNLDALKIRRRTLKGSVTRIQTFVDSMQSITSESVCQLIDRRDNLNKFWEQYQEIQNAIDELDVNEDESYRTQFEETYYTLSGKVRAIFARHNENVNRATPTNTNNTNRSDNSSTGNVRLPKINLPEFTGKYDEWVPFFNVFNSVINQNQGLSKIQKFQYLLSSISGEPYGIISSLELTDANYDIALQLIKDRYDNSRIIVYSHIKEIFEMPVMNKENYRQLKSLIDGTNKHLRALHSLGRPTDNWDDIIIFVLTSKLDNVTNKEWQTSVSGKNLPSLKELLEILTKKYQALEVTVSSNKNVHTEIHHNNSSFNKSKKQSMTHVVTTDVKCIMCGGDHAIYQCSGFLNLSKPARLDSVRKKNICTNCLRSTNHGSSKCYAKGCKLCGAKHNTLLHLGQSNPKVIKSEGQVTKPSEASNSADNQVHVVSNSSVVNSNEIFYGIN